MKRSDGEKLALLVEAGKRTLLIYERMHSRLWSNLRLAEDLINKNHSVEDSAPDIFIDCMGLIDTAHRFWQLLDAMPRISKKAPAMRLLKDATDNAESARHYIQHMRRELLVDGPITYPVLGSIAWAQGQRDSFFIGFDQAGAKQYGLVFDAWRRRYVREIEYSIGNFMVDFNNIRSRMHVAYAWLLTQIQSDPAGVTELKWGTPISLRVAMPDIVPPQPD